MRVWFGKIKMSEGEIGIFKQGLKKIIIGLDEDILYDDNLDEDILYDDNGQTICNN